MRRKSELVELVKKKTVILDGSTGVLLQSKGMPSGVCPEMWCLENPDIIKAIHSQYKKAGADIIYSFTFGANAVKMKEYGLSDVYGINRRLAELARNSVGKSVFVAGNLSPTGLFVEPSGPLGFEEAVNVFKDQVKGLLDGGVDLFVIETMLDIQEARAALIAIKEISDTFTIVTMTYENNGRTLTGTDPVSALITLQSLGADAIGCNCSSGPEQMLPLISAMKPYSKVPLVAKPNAGLPKLVDGKTVFDMGPEEFGSFGRIFIEAGANILGGCCGTTPEHIRHISENVSGLLPSPPMITSIGALSSSTGHLILDRESPVRVIGERINPTGKKALLSELKDGKMSLIRQFVNEQSQAGAEVLDINVGVPGVDETALMRSVVGLVSKITGLCLSIDSSKPEAIENALRLYPGRALVNSISGEESKIKALLPVAAKYGAMFILLPLTDAGIPETLGGRSAVIENIFKESLKYGFTKQDIIVDALTMAVSAEQDAAGITLETIKWCSDEFGARTVLGLSNISFGLPERKWINASFFAMAALNGLSMAIVNPSSEELMAVKFASDVITGRDKEAKRYISRYAHEKPLPSANLSNEQPEDCVSRSIIEGDRQGITGFIEKALASGAGPSKLVNDIMIPAIRKVGLLYEKGTYFLPQLIAGAEAMQKGFSLIEPLLDKKEAAKKGKIIMATVKGDIHDIGKSIVSLLLRNNGFDVIDLGKDVPNEVIIKSVRDHNPDIVGLSALMTTTMAVMEDVIKTARASGITCPFMVGGAVVTSSFASSIGASYAKDGVEAVKVAESLLKK